MRLRLLTLAAIAALLIPASAATFLEKLTASDAAAGDFMSSVLIDGDTLIANTVGGGTGAVYVFRQAAGSWSEEAKLTAPVYDAFDFFGRAMAIDGDTIAVGALGDHTHGSYTGAVYVFVRSGTAWSLEAKLTAADPRSNHGFGAAVAVSGDTIVVGATNDDDLGSRAGAVYVFTRVAGTWSQEAKLTASVGAPDDGFGNSVAIDGDTLLIGASAETKPVGSRIGSAYLFTRSGGTWTEDTRIPSNSTTDDNFGSAVALQGDTAVIAAWRDNDANTNGGAVYVYRNVGGTWWPEAKLLSPTSVYNFGMSIALDGNVLAAGTTWDYSAATLGGGVAVFTRSGGSWSLHEKITAFDASAFDFFGTGVALRGKTLAVAAQRDDDAATDAGAVYLYDLDIVTNEPPVCSAAAPSVASLWPPNHEMVDVEVEGVTDPDGDPVTITIDSIHQDEPVEGTGDGETAPDGAGVGTASAEVRAECDGGGDGRVYHIRFTASDGQGGTCSGEVLVTVPKSQGASGAAVDGGALHDSTQER